MVGRKKQSPLLMPARDKPNISLVRQVRCINEYSVPTDSNTPTIPFLEVGKVYKVVGTKGDMYIFRNPKASGPEKLIKFRWDRFEVLT